VNFNKRGFLIGGAALGSYAAMPALAQQSREPIPRRTATTHPGWPNFDSPNSGYIFEIDIA
jgi:hypothetical protein